MCSQKRKEFLILGFAKIAYMPYLSFYLRALKNENVNIHVVTWQRDNATDAHINQENVILHPFMRYQLDQVPKVSKIRNFIFYRKFVLDLLNAQKFDGIIALHTMPAVLLADILCKQYPNRYIFDYRDQTYERFNFFKKLIGKIVKKSYATFVSSEAYRDNLPNVEHIYASHNILPEDISHSNVRPMCDRKHTPIRISFWGFIREYETNRVIIQRLENDSRFELHFYGKKEKVAADLERYVQVNGIDNVFFHGGYLPSERLKFVQETDIIHNIYQPVGNMGKAMSNKYYDSIVFKIPQLCAEGSYMAERTMQEKVGLPVNIYDETLGNQIEKYYREIQWDKFEHCCNVATNQVMGEYMIGIEKVQSLLEHI